MAKTPDFKYAPMFQIGEVVTEEWEGNTTKVTTTTETSNHLIRILTCHRHLLLCL